MAENTPDDPSNPIAERAVASVADAVRIATEASLAAPAVRPVRKPVARAAAVPASPVMSGPPSEPLADSPLADGPAPVELPPSPSLPPAAVVAAMPTPVVPVPVPVAVPMPNSMLLAAMPPPPDVPSPVADPTPFTRKMETMMTTAEELMSFQQGNIEAMIRSSQIWVTGLQDLGRTLAASAQAHMDETFGTVKALTAAKSLREAVELQSTLARTSVEKAVSEGGKLTDASMKLAEQTLAPITARLTLAAERFGRSAA